MSEELKWSISITFAGLLGVVIAYVSGHPHYVTVWAKVYGAVALVGVVGLVHVAYIHKNGG
jgi:hypothetical protein